MNSPMAGIAVVRLTIDGLRHQIVAAIADHDKTIKVSIERAVDDAIAEFDFDGEVRRLCAQFLQEKVRISLEHAISDAFADETLQSAVHGAVGKAARAAFGVKP